MSKDLDLSVYLVTDTVQCGALGVAETVRQAVQAGATLDITSGSASDTLDFTNIHSVADFDAAVSALSVTGLTIASTSGNLSITADDNATSFTVADGSTTGAAAAIGVAEQDYDPSNSAIAALSGTLTFTTDTGTDTLTFGSSGIQTRADLETALAGLSTSGVTASINSSLTVEKVISSMIWIP